ncbi:MAG: hypothetical protein ACRCYC_04030, partial [Paraclostridium sp.]|uniref:hypothetical protein n=1 Tax=Paraclostridium sp. TaxID=2023273 RepID=UPI003F2F1B34
MGRFTMIIVTTLTLSVLIIRNRRIDKYLKKTIKSTIKEINKTYIDLFKEKNILTRLIQGSLIVFAEISSFAAIYTSIVNHLKITLLSSNIEWCLKIFIILTCFTIVHYSIGYMLYLSLKIQNFIHDVEHKNLKIDFLLSYFM